VLRVAKNEINQFGIFRDASFGTCSYNLSLMDVLNGLYKVHKVTIIQIKRFLPGSLQNVKTLVRLHACNLLDSTSQIP